MLKYLAGIPTITGHARARELARAVLGGKHKPEEVVIVDNASRDGMLHCSEPRMTRIHQGKNLGVAASWNLIIARARELACDAVVLLNDDIRISTDSMRVLLRELGENNFPIAGPTTLPFTCFALRLPEAIEEIGLFDEGFYPAYFEDDDYMWRMQLAGYTDLLRVDVVDLGIEWPSHSTTRAEASPELRKLIEDGYEASRVRYEQKWGAQPGHEIFVHPYDAAGARWWRRLR